ncbi:hypothetical protein BpHYR1_033631 [Brachionus plicatilis]|uniref:Uncharacterized protein n=1 Tax=Brachionus plicatilis TaxID=10195 RepID=A0A3M7PZM4_BRAPC|nr:hypothetical protein BpHYR1_033631 [Brachionus plicatilis]
MEEKVLNETTGTDGMKQNGTEWLEQNECLEQNGFFGTEWNCWNVNGMGMHNRIVLIISYFIFLIIPYIVSIATITTVTTISTVIWKG